MELPKHNRLVCMLTNNIEGHNKGEESRTVYKHAQQLAKLLDKEESLLLLSDVCDWEESKGTVRLAGGVVFDKNDGWKPKEVYSKEPLGPDIFYSWFTTIYGADREINRIRYKRMIRRYGTTERVLDEYRRLCKLIKAKPKGDRVRGARTPDYEQLYDLVGSAVYHSHIFAIGETTMSSWGGKANEYNHMTRVLGGNEREVNGDDFVIHIPKSAILKYSRISLLFALRTLQKIMRVVKSNSPQAKYAYVVKHDSGSQGHGMIFCKKANKLYRAMGQSLKELAYMQPPPRNKFLVQEYVPLKFTGNERGFEQFAGRAFTIRVLSFGKGFDLAYVQIGERNSETSHGNKFLWLGQNDEFYRYLTPEILDVFGEAIMQYAQKKHKGRIPNASIWPIGFDFGIAKLENPKRMALIYLESNNRPFLSRLEKLGKLELYSKKMAEYILEQLESHHYISRWW